MLDQGIDRFEQLARLDPRSPDGAMSLGAAYARLGRYDDADTALARARSLRPSSIAIGFMRTMLAAARGDLAGARQELRALESSAGRRRVMAYAALRENLVFALDDEQQQVLLGLTPADLDGGKADWALALAEVSWLHHDLGEARSYGRSASDAYAQLLESWGQSADREQVMMLRAFGLAYAGRAAEAVAEAERALALERQLGFRNAYLPFISARINVLGSGKQARAGDGPARRGIAAPGRLFTRMAANRFDICPAPDESAVPATRVERLARVRPSPRRITIARPVRRQRPSDSLPGQAAQPLNRFFQEPLRSRLQRRAPAGHYPGMLNCQRSRTPRLGRARSHLAVPSGGTVFTSTAAQLASRGASSQRVGRRSDAASHGC
jgi:hypothetical protein